MRDGPVLCEQASKVDGRLGFFSFLGVFYVSQTKDIRRPALRFWRGTGTKEGKHRKNGERGSEASIKEQGEEGEGPRK